MSLQVEKLEKNMAKLTIEVSAEEFDKAMNNAYHKQKAKINIPGFRKGKAPRAMIEKMYGAGIFYEEAANAIIPEAYANAAEESGLEIVSQPDIDVVQIEKGKAFIFTAEVAVKPEVTLGEYKGVQVEKKTAEVTEEEVNDEIARVREQNSRTIVVEDRPAQNGDMTVVDFEGFVDGVAFEGGKGTDYPLTLGTHSFIDTFEDQLVGKNIGEEVEVNVTFPEEYHAKDLAGKPAMFKVTIKEIKVKELPDLDDEFAQDVSEFETLAEYREDVKKNIEGRKVAALQREKEEAVVAKVVENATMEVPEPMVASEVRRMADEFAQRIQSQGLSLEQYFQFTGLTANKFMEDLKPQALKRIESRLVLEAVVKAENIQASEEDIEKEIADMAAMYQMEVDKLKELLGDYEKEQIALDMAVQKAVELLVNESVEVE